MKLRSLSLLLATALILPLTSYAEYYVVYDRGCCKGCRHHVRHYRKVIHHRAHRMCGRPRHIRANAMVYYVRPTIPCRGCPISREASCGGNCEGWFPSAWEASNYEILATKPVFFENDYDPDLATADDDQFYYPDLNIDR